MSSTEKETKMVLQTNTPDLNEMLKTISYKRTFDEPQYTVVELGSLKN